MSDKRKWSETRDARFKSSADRARYAAGKERFLSKLDRQLQTLSELRRARSLTQEQLAATMRVSQAQVSRVENQADLYLSTLRSYIEALGGELQIRVAFPGNEWTEIAIGDVTGIETTSSAVEAVALSSINAIKEVSQPLTYGNFSIKSLSGVLARPVVLSACTATWWASASRSDDRAAEELASWLWSDIHLAGSAHIVSHSSGVVSHHHALETSMHWVDPELKVPADTNDFVASASFRER